MTLKKEESDQSEQLKKYTLEDVEEFLKKGISPPGIKQYNDLPSEEKVQPTECKLEKKKKPWETDENIKTLNFITNDVTGDNV